MKIGESTKETFQEPWIKLTFLAIHLFQISELNFSHTARLFVITEMICINIQVTLNLLLLTWSYIEQNMWPM